MFTKPEITNPEDLSSRGYVSFYYDHIRKRYYHGSSLGLECNPNQCTTLHARKLELEKLQYHIHRLLLAGWNPLTTPDNTGVRASKLLSEEFIKHLFKTQGISERHLEDLVFHAGRFLDYLESKHISKINSIDISQDIAQNYLETCVNNNYYMIIRNRLQSLFTVFFEKHYILANPFVQTKPRKKVPKLNKAFTESQLHLVLETMKNTNQRLYLCALLMYGCFLRPHEEIRNIKRRHFSDDLTRIVLASEENKGRDIRITPVPAYVRDALVKYGINAIDCNEFLFTVNKGRAVNEDYFTNVWKKVKRKLLRETIIDKEHTLYSLRHTAAIRLFNKTQNLAKLSQVMGHKDVQITLTYLRSLGILLNIDENDMPEL